MGEAAEEYAPETIPCRTGLELPTGMELVAVPSLTVMCLPDCVDTASLKYSVMSVLPARV